MNANFALNRTRNTATTLSGGLSFSAVARSRNNNEHSTMQLMPNAEGMDMRADLDIENNAEARALYSATARGDMTGMSFAFIVDRDSWDDIDSDHPVRHIRSIWRHGPQAVRWTARWPHWRVRGPS